MVLVVDLFVVIEIVEMRIGDDVGEGCFCGEVIIVLLGSFGFFINCGGLCWFLKYGEL